MGRENCDGVVKCHAYIKNNLKSHTQMRTLFMWGSGKSFLCVDVVDRLHFLRNIQRQRYFSLKWLSDYNYWMQLLIVACKDVNSYPCHKPNVAIVGIVMPAMFTIPELPACRQPGTNTLRRSSLGLVARLTPNCCTARCTRTNKLTRTGSTSSRA